MMNFDYNVDIMSNSQYSVGLVQTNALVGRTLILPLAIGMIWNSAMLSKCNRSRYQLQHICYRQESLNEQAKILSVLSLVCMSMYVWNYEWQLKLARKIKSYNPNCFVLAGGPFFSDNDDTFWNQYRDCIDCVILGEGDNAFREFLEVWPNESYRSVKGAWTSSSGTGIANRVHTLDMIPSPYLSGFYDHIIDTERALGIMIQVVLQTNRGCPYHCSFCEEGKEYKNKIYVASLDSVLAEIDWCGQQEIEYVSIADDNWGILERDVMIAERLCQTKVRYGYPRVVDATFAKNAPERVVAIARLDSQYKTHLLRGITVALQSSYVPTLKAIRRFNLVENKQSLMIKQLHDMKFPMYTEIIWPLPYETLTTFTQGLDKIIDSGLTNWCAVYPISIYKSADLWNDHAKDYVFSNHSSTKDSWYHPPGVSSKANVIPMASKWATIDDVVYGHVVYNWLANLYFFGWARPAMIYLHRVYNLTWTEITIDFLKWISRHGNTWREKNRLFESFWYNHLQQHDLPNLNPLTTDEVKCWYTYTHLAHWISLDQFEFYLTLLQWLQTKVPRDVSESLVYMCKVGVIDHQEKYPRNLRDGSLQVLDAEQIQILDPVECSTYYFWYKRKKGLNIINLDHSPEWQDLLGLTKTSSSTNNLLDLHA